MQSPNICNQASAVQCFKMLSDHRVDAILQKQADTYLASCEQSCSQFIEILMKIFESNESDLIKLQALICFNNVLKRNYLNKRIKNTTAPNFEKLKSMIKGKLIQYLINSPQLYRKTLLDALVFIAQIDYPHNFEQLTPYFQQMLQQVKDVNFLKQNINALNQIYKKKQIRSIVINKKHFQQTSFKILIKLYQLFESLFQNIQKSAQKQFSLIRSIVKSIFLILTTSPNDIIDNQQLMRLIETMYSKSQTILLQIISTPAKSDQIKQQYQKTLKVFVQYFGYLQYRHPFSLILCYKPYLQLLIFIISNHQKFKNYKLMKYTISSLNKVLKSFVYYAATQEFQNSSHSKSKTINFLEFRKKIHEEYKEIINQKNMEQLLSKIITEVLSIKDLDSFDAGIGVQDQQGKIDQKDASVQRLTLGLVETIVNRFPIHSYNLMLNLVNSSISNNFENIDKNIKINIMNVCSIMPSALRSNNAALLTNFPIQSLISYAFNSGQLADKFALLSCKWIERFTPQQTLQIVSALLSYIDNNSSNLAILLQCCLAIKTIVLTKSQEINLSNAVEKIIPVAIKLFSLTQSVQILWPMITLISKLISSVQCNLQTLQNALACNSLIALLQTNQQLIIEALCQMFKNIICTLPRDQQQPVTYNLILSFLSNQLNKTQIACYQEVLKLWYLTLREYSQIQDKNNELKTLFDRFYRVSLRSTFNQKLLFIIQQYVLLGLVGLDQQLFSSILIQFYDHCDDQQITEDEKFRLKIAVTSVHITFITKFGMDAIHNNELLLRYLQDLIEPIQTSNKLLDTCKTSILALVNRYIILYKKHFVDFVNGTNKYTFNHFLRGWFSAMQSLTSKTACKINAIALLYMVQDLQLGLLKNRFQYIMKKVIPEVIDSLTVIPFQNKVGVSPTYRLSQNILSQRKQAIRRLGVFDQINMKQLFVNTIKKLITKNMIDQPTVEHLLSSDKTLLETFYKLVA